MLQVTNISKAYKTVRAVDDLTFDVQRGEIFALLGPNGAGKTTLVRMLMGIIPPDQGSFTFDLGGGPTDKPDAELLGYLPEDRGLYKEMPILKTLVFMASLRGMDRKTAQSEGRAWLERLDLGERVDDKLDTLSKGNQQKVQFISAILHKPKVVLLDEPFSGLDPVNQERFLGLIRELRDQGMTILLSAHQMDLVERLADRLLLMHQGCAVLSGALTEIQSRSDVGGHLELHYRDPIDAAAFKNSALFREVEQRSERVLALNLHRESSLNDILQFAASLGELLDIHTRKATLYDIYLDAVGHDAVGHDAVGSHSADATGHKTEETA